MATITKTASSSIMDSFTSAKLQDFMVSWVDCNGEDKFRNFESLAEADDFMETGRIYSPESYVYLSIVIKTK